MSSSTREVSNPALGRWSKSLPDGRVQCRLCPRLCTLKEGQRGFCFIRRAEAGEVVLESYGRASGFCVDPIEKKPLNHFYPGSSVLSFGTAGCCLGCKFCQNHDISKARAMDTLMERAGPAEIADAALNAGCKSVAFTYNDPVIFAEYAIDTALACRERGVSPVVVSAGYITADAREDFFAPMAAANIDLKAFDEHFYKSLTLSSLEPVLDTLRWIHHESSVWLEITTLVIEGVNDSAKEIDAIARFIVEELDDEVPLHLSAFHPDFKMLDHRRTRASTLLAARDRALAAGLRHVYTGNVHDPQSQSTYCAGCGQMLIAREGYNLGVFRLDSEGRCEGCGHKLCGHFDAKPGKWGSRRLPIAIGR